MMYAWTNIKNSFSIHSVSTVLSWKFVVVMMVLVRFYVYFALWKTITENIRRMVWNTEKPHGNLWFKSPVWLGSNFPFIKQREHKISLRKRRRPYEGQIYARG